MVTGRSTGKPTARYKMPAQQEISSIVFRGIGNTTRLSRLPSIGITIDQQQDTLNVRMDHKSFLTFQEYAAVYYNPLLFLIPVAVAVKVMSTETIAAVARQQIKLVF
jgi:hypothetical protein